MTIDIVTGEKIQYLCDHYLSLKFQFNPKCCTYNPTLFNEKKIIYEELNIPFDNKKYIHIETELYERKDLLEKLKLFKNNFILISHNSDYHFKEKYFYIFKEIPNLIKIFSQNTEISNEKIIPLPIGLANSKWKHGDIFFFKNYIENNLKLKNKHVYFNFNINTNLVERSLCKRKLNKLFKWENNIPFVDYIKKLSNYEFSICPPGNGVDCHRIWECLYMKVVPICKRSFLTEHFSKLFPIIILDDWNDLDISKLNYDDYSWENYDKLDFEWWKEKILNNK